MNFGLFFIVCFLTKVFFAILAVLVALPKLGHTLWGISFEHPNLEVLGVSYPYYQILFGTIIPLAIMCIYIAIGIYVYRKKTRAEKISFGDSCYYMGFLFTIVSIILILVDIGLQDLGVVSKAGGHLAELADQSVPQVRTVGSILNIPLINVSDVAMRFGVAMITTVLGMLIRLWMITFAKKDSDNALDILSGGRPIDDGKSNSSNEQYASLKAREISPDDSLEVIIEASCENLRRLNLSLAGTLEAFMKLRDDLLNLSGRVRHDLEAQTDEMKTFQSNLQKQMEQSFDALLEQSREHLKQLSEANQKQHQSALDSIKVASGVFTESLNSHCNNFKDIVDKSNDVILQSAKNSQNSLNEQAEKISADIVKSGEKLNQSVASLGEEISSSSQKVHKSLENQLISVGHKLSESSDKFVTDLDKLGTKISAYKFEINTDPIEKSISSLSQRIENIGDSVSESTNRTQEALQSEVKNFVNTISDSGKSIESTINNLNKKIESTPFNFNTRPVDEAIKSVGQTVLQVNSVMKDAVHQISDLPSLAESTTNEVRSVLDKQNSQIRQTTESLQDLQSATSETLQSVDRLKADMKDIHPKKSFFGFLRG